MAYPTPGPEDRARFHRDGFLVVENAIPEDELTRLNDAASEILRRKHELARDWDWRKGQNLSERTFRIVQCFFSNHFEWAKEAPFRTWATRYAEGLMGNELVFWYDQFLGKPANEGAATPWHQDEGYWGKNLWDLGITCWMSFHDVDVSNGCMHFVRGGHKNGVLEHRVSADHASGLLLCDVPANSDVVACPLRAGSVTFHHGKTPHMTPPNLSGNWRLTLAQHFRPPHVETEGGDYPWRVRISQDE
jgi:phytanoyl-CoA hydroxylase